LTEAVKVTVPKFPEKLNKYHRKHQTVLFIIPSKDEAFENRVKRMLESVNDPGMCVDVATVHLDEDKKSIQFMRWGDHVRQMTFKGQSFEIYPKNLDDFACTMGYTASMVMWNPALQEMV